MYVNKCTKCGAEFETKNPKRVICPNCLYPDKKNDSEGGADFGDSSQNQQHSAYERPAAYSAGGYSTDNSYQRPYQQERPRYDGQRNYNQTTGYQRPQYNSGYNRPQGGYQRPQQGGYNRRPYDRDGGQRSYNQGGYQRPQQGGYNRPQGGYQRPQRPQGGRPSMGGRKPSRPQNRPPKQLLVNKEQLLQIEELYKKMLPLPNPDAHEVIGEQIGLEARKVFFGINLVRQKLMLPKLPYPKRKLAVSPDQLSAIKMLYEPLLPLPPIGCHKIIASQLKIDEWRVHVGIGLIRKQLGLDRWNPEREDAPEEFKQQVKSVKESQSAAESEVEATETTETEDKPKKRGRKKAADTAEETKESD